VPASNVTNTLPGVRAGFLRNAWLFSTNGIRWPRVKSIWVPSGWHRANHQRTLPFSHVRAGGREPWVPA
jgi:hypothetical protein